VIDTRIDELLAGVPTGLFIHGTWRAATDSGSFAVSDPATGRQLAEVADATPADAVAALDAAAAAQDAWAATPARARGEILRAVFEAMTARKDELALLVTLEMGKTLRESEAEVAYAAEFFRWFSEEAVRVSGRWAREPGGSGYLMTSKHPVGPCLLITPWNFPLAMGTRKIGPALAAGCTVIIKPAQQTPLAMNLLVQLLADAGVPRGVVNVITSSSASAVVKPLLEDSRLRKLSFTGSTEVGRLLVAQAAPTLLRVSMELGGNAPFIVFADADLDRAVDQAVIAKMRNMGQSCVAANRFYVADEVAEEFTSRFAERLSELRLGHGADPVTDVGPLIDEAQQLKVTELLADAVDRGASIVSSAPDSPAQGHFFAPVVLADVAPEARLHHEEIFGPVAPIYRFSHPEEAITLANSTPFGLVSYLFTQDLNLALASVERLESGMVGVNKGLVSNPAAPFGGIKQSGLGREGGSEGIEEYLYVKYAGLA
jgi:succinate-semialdehyde dehydrogenase/glutarate-semialdehyde dehydrogenase